MATGRTFYAQPSYRFLPADHHHPPASADSGAFEFDESDLFSSPRSNSPEFRKLAPSSRLSKKLSKRSDPSSRAGSCAGATPASLPVNIPDWSKILKEDYRESGWRESNDDDDVESGDEDGVKIPPHEFIARQMARTRIAPFSVYEGIGRTLKGRDLRRVRNAIWEKTGFQD